MVRSSFLALIFLGCLSSASIAVTSAAPAVTNNDPFSTCMANVDLGAMKNTQFLSCYRAELGRQDAKLNAIYVQRKSKLSSSMQSALTQGQRAWLTYRDTWCALEGMSDQAPSPEVNKADCIVSLTKEQIKRIDSINPNSENSDGSSGIAIVPQITKPQEANRPPLTSIDSVNTAELCENYTEGYTQNMKMDIITKRLNSNSDQAIKFKQQQQVCPQWRVNQQLEAKKNFKTGLQTLIMGLPECQSQKQQLEATFGQALGYPELDQEIESGMIALGIGQKDTYCKKINNVVSPYVRLRDLVYKCSTNKSANISGALNETFGRLATEMRQNGCSLQ